MTRFRRIWLACAPLALFAALLAPASARAALRDPLGFRFSSPAYFVHENAGVAVITVERTNTVPAAQIRYLTTPGSAVKNDDYTPVKSMIDLLPGQASATFTVRIVDHGVPGLPRTLGLALFGPSPIGLATPSHAMLTIINDDPVQGVRDALNPLALPSPPPSTDPLTGAVPFVDNKYSLAAEAIRGLHGRHPREAGLLEVIAREPQVERFGNWTSDPGLQVSQFLERAAIQAPGTVPELSTYWLVDGAAHRDCHHYADPAWRVAKYHNWIEGLARGIGARRAILFLDMDSLITIGCLSREGLAVRMHELHDAVDILSQAPHLVVYLDAGAADALSARTAARLLERAGVAETEGFFLNSTHFDWTKREIAYGEKISRLTGGKHFVVNTAENGRGPLVPRNRVRHGNEVLCDPPGRGLGPLPTFSTGYPNVDAFAWIANPGKSGGHCRAGSPPTGFFWDKLAIELIKHADFRVR